MAYQEPEIVYEEFENQIEDPANKVWKNINPRYIVVVMILMVLSIFMFWYYPTMDKIYILLILGIEVGGGLLIAFSQGKKEFIFIKEEQARIKAKKYLDYHHTYLTRYKASDLPDGEYKIGKCFRVDQSSPWNKPLYWVFNFSIITSTNEEKQFHLEIDGSGDIITLNDGHLTKPVKVVYRVSPEQQADYAWKKGGVPEWEGEYGQN